MTRRSTTRLLLALESSAASSPHRGSRRARVLGNAQHHPFAPSSLGLAVGPATVLGRFPSRPDRRESATKGTSR
jgi:hypothetical protein